MKIDSLADVGTTRQENQDNFWSSILEVDGKEAGILCLCDGMGGLENGAIASRMVVSEVKDAITSGMGLESIPEILAAVNSSIYSLGLQIGRMGTTCTILYCCEGRYEIVHIGDSRCYLVNKEGQSELLTIDHSVINEYGLTKESNEKLWKKYKNSLTRCIGTKDTLRLDRYEGVYSSEDKFFVCSDGFWHYVSTLDCLEGKLNDLGSLIEECKTNGESDNITVSVLYA